MSSLPGGAADKFGGNHEASWGVRCMLDVLAGDADAIRIEPPGVDKAEFYLVRDGRRQYWQAKRQLLNQDSWSLGRLMKEGVLGFFFEKVRDGATCVFASISDAPELRMLSENAREAENFAEFEKEFQKEKKLKAEFDTLAKDLGSLSPDETYRFLQGVEVEGARERTLDTLLRYTLGVLFTGTGEATFGVLSNYYARSAHHTRTRDDILAYLATCGVKPRDAAITPDLAARVRGVTEAYLANLRTKLINRHPAPRAEVAGIVSQLTAANTSLSVVLTGAAGAGKSSCCEQIVSHLLHASVPTFVIRLDGFSAVKTTIELGAELGLPESPVVVLNRAYPSGPFVLLVDQLDFVSTTSGRNPDFFDTVAALCAEVEGLRRTRIVHLVLVCRKFDYENDPRLRQLVPKDQAPLEITRWSVEEVKAAIVEAGENPALLGAPQLEILRLPQNLALFLAAGPAKAGGAFVTTTQLFDLYWKAKQSAMATRLPAHTADWARLMSQLTQEMSNRQELSVPETVLDIFAPGYVGALVSEGVLTLDRRRYAFAHESLFDYSYARGIAASQVEFAQVLEGDVQQLFRRAQLRQVLNYLRDDQFPRYLTNVTTVLNSTRIRSHLKLLALELIANVPNPRDEELGAFRPFLDGECAASARGCASGDAIAARATDVFWGSDTLFPVAARTGLIQRWLDSADDAWIDWVFRYFRRHLEQQPDLVAGFLEPLIGRGGKWSERLRVAVGFGEVDRSRRLFDVFLRLIDDGTLDDPPDAANRGRGFWSTLHRIAERSPALLAEIAAHWLDRQVAIKRAPDDNEYAFGGERGVSHLQTSAREAPERFLSQVLPAIVRAVVAFAEPPSTPGALQSDKIWPWRIPSQHATLLESYLIACESCFENLGATRPAALAPHAAFLKPAGLNTTNDLLLGLYASAPAHFADEALQLLTLEPARRHSGAYGSPYWTARTVIERCSPHCSDAVFRALESELLGFVPAEEAEDDDQTRHGYAAYTLALGLAPSRRSPAMAARLSEWAAQFEHEPRPPEGVRTYSIESPVKKEEAENYTDDEWLAAIAKYAQSRIRSFPDPMLGGADEFAGVLQAVAKDEPERFARLALRFPPNISASYYMNLLYGIRSAEIDEDLKIAVVRQGLAQNSRAATSAAFDVLGSIAKQRLPDDLVERLKQVALAPDDIPAGDGATLDEKQVLTKSWNSMQAHALRAIGALLMNDAGYLGVFLPTIEVVLAHPFAPLRAAAAPAWLAIAPHDTPLAISLLPKLLGNEPRLYAAGEVQRLIRATMRDHLAAIRPHLNAMLDSEHAHVREHGGLCSCLARLHHASADDLAERSLSLDSSTRRGATIVANDNLLHQDCQLWCVAALVRLFRDPDVKIRGEAAQCFRSLWQHPEIPLSRYEALIADFVASPAFETEPTFLLYALEAAREPTPQTILLACEAFVDRCAPAARDMRTSMAADQTTVGTLVFRAYAQLRSQTEQKRALDLIDRMCAEGLQSARDQLTEFDR